jgi:hypothetical protein
MTMPHTDILKEETLENGKCTLEDKATPHNVDIFFLYHLSFISAPLKQFEDTKEIVRRFYVKWLGNLLFSRSN